MQQAIPYKSWLQPLHTNTTLLDPSPISLTHKNPVTKIVKETKDSSSIQSMVSENAVIVFARRGCCMSHVVKLLLLGLGVNPAVYEVDEEDEAGVLNELDRINNNNSSSSNGSSGDDHQKVQFPAVFIGGRLFGGLDRIMATHISGDLVPVLKEAKALWL